jgi:uncharacterized membrane protein
MFAMLRRYFISGLLVWLPILITVFALRFLLGLLDRLYGSIPARFHIDYVFGVNIPGLEIIVLVLIVFITGVFAANYFGKKLVKLGDFVIGKIPIVRTIYLGVKQILDTIFSSKGKAFRNVMLVEYPRKGLWAIAFQTSEAGQSFGESIGDQDIVTLFLPTTPNPTSGFLFMVPRKDIVELDISVDQAMKFVISLGVVQPESDPGCLAEKISQHK